MHKVSHRIVRAAIAVMAIGVTAAVASIGGQSSGARTGEWRSYGSNLANTRYSPLDQINADNFNKLEIAWRFKTENLGPRPEFNFESTPLMVNGVVYSTAGTRRSVVALDATTGELRWVFGMDEGRRSEASPRQLSGRGLSYWTDGREERIVFVTIGYQLVELDAKTGRPVPGFGKNGVVDLKQDADQPIDPITGDIGLHSAPAVAGDVIVVGAAHEASGYPRSKTNVKGFVRAYDARTGKRLWIFHTIPRPGEFGNDTWLNDSWSYTGNAGVWGQISVDEEAGLVYLPVETPTGDFYAGDRPGNNLFGESLVAVELKTGKRRWHYQFVHHGIWDYDLPCAPILVEVVKDGRTIKAVAQPSKQAFLYVLNRLTGEPIWPIEERPVPKGDVPGEWYSPTQPVPLNGQGQPFAYDRQGVSVDDLIDFTPELRAEALKVVARYRMGPLFTPPALSKREGPLGTLTAPTSVGGSNWPGGGYDPETHLVYLPSASSVGSMSVVPPTPATTDVAYVSGTALSGPRRTSDNQPGARPQPRPAAPAPAATPAPADAGASAAGGGGLSVQGLPLTKPPYGKITAIDINKGAIRWQIAHGETPDNIKNHPALKGLTIPRTGQPNTGKVGLALTKTLVIAGESTMWRLPSGVRGTMLHAYDKASGKEVGAVPMPAPQTGSPMTYMVNGKQYIVVAVSGGNYPGELLAFRLPG